MSKAPVQTEWPVERSEKSSGIPNPAEDRLPRIPRLKPVDRQQMMLRMVDVEQLIEADHPARAIWELTGRMNWSGFYTSIQAVEGVAGRQAWDPRLLSSVWIYAYSRGIGSAREVARRCGYDPGFQWLTGLTEVNYHTLADFRVDHQSELDELFVQVLGLLSAEGLITLERVAHDGTKIQACAGRNSFRREEKLRAHLEEARQQVVAMGDPTAEPSVRQRAARQRAQRERAERLEKAVAELEIIRQAKVGTEAQAQSRVSETDPEARVMKQGDGGYAPSYNVQLSTDAAHGLIVGMGVSQACNDVGELVPAVQRIEQNLGQKPKQMVVDGGFTTRENILEMEVQGVDLIGSLSEYGSSSARALERRGVKEKFYPEAFTYDAILDLYRCPAGETLRQVHNQTRRGIIQYHYRAETCVCAACPFKKHCCPQRKKKGRTIIRVEKAPALQAFMTKMQTEAAQATYRIRGAVAEFPNAWIKTKIGLRQFCVRGRAKVSAEALWACLTYNIQQWIRLRWHGPSQILAA